MRPGKDQEPECSLRMRRGRGGAPFCAKSGVPLSSVGRSVAQRMESAFVSVVK